MAPSLITHYEVYSGAQNANTLTTPTFTPANGEVLVIKGTTWDTARGLDTPTGGSQTYQQINIAAPAVPADWAGIWVATVSGSPVGMSVSITCTGALATWHSLVVERWSGAKLAVSPATNTTKNGSGTPLATITTTASNSVISWCSCDDNSRSPVGATFNTSSGGVVTADGLFDGSAASHTVQYFLYQTAPTAGVNNVGITSPGLQQWVLVGVEVQAATAAAAAPPPRIVSQAVKRAAFY